MSPRIQPVLVPRPGTPWGRRLGPGAGGVVLLDRGVVLRRMAKGEWVFPKGDVEEGELLRETREKSPFWRYHKGKDAFLFSSEEALERFYFPAGRREPLEDGV